MGYWTWALFMPVAIFYSKDWIYSLKGFESPGLYKNNILINRCGKNVAFFDFKDNNLNTLAQMILGWRGQNTWANEITNWKRLMKANFGKISTIE